MIKNHTTDQYNMYGLSFKAVINDTAYNDYYMPPWKILRIMTDLQNKK